MSRSPIFNSMTNLQRMSRLFLALWLAAACSGDSSQAKELQATEPSEYLEPRVYSYEVVRKYPHDPEAFTQGLLYLEGVLYEGTGLNGRSSLRKVDLESGQVLQQRDIEQRFFGEGIAVFANRILQITWQAHTAFAYDLDTFEPLAQFSYPTEGWGLTHDGERLIMSDGTSTLYFRDPFSFEQTGQIAVLQGDKPVANLNELEYINGEVYANIWQSGRIARIDPQSGQITAWIDLSGLLSAEDRGGRRVDVLNGIAYDQANDRLFVTGKWWPVLYEIKLVLKQQP
jgi:glutaminyl-peptide cyclotransferase